MITRRQFVLGAAALPLSGQLFAAQSFTAGKEYLAFGSHQSGQD